MTEWKTWNYRGHEDPRIEILKLSDGAEITLTDERGCPEWTAELAITKNDIRYRRTFTFVPDEVALAADPAVLRETMRGLAAKHATEHLTLLRQLAADALDSLSPHGDSHAYPSP